RLLDQADEAFGTTGSSLDARVFYDAMLKRAGIPAVGAFAEELRDRALLTLARLLRQDLERGLPAPYVISSLFGGTGHWPAALVRDAEFAATGARRRARDRAAAAGRDPQVQGVQVGRGPVTAVCQAPASGDLYLGFGSGLVLEYRPGTGR